MPITISDARNLKPGEILIDNNGKRWKVNGNVQTWKRNSSRIRIPLKHGLYAYDSITEADFDEAGNCKWISHKEHHGDDVARAEAHARYEEEA